MWEFDPNQITTQTWRNFCKHEFKKQYFKELQKKILLASLKNTVYPPPDLVFNAFNLCSWSQTKVVIIGQDPYHNPGQAMGLAFSHPKSIGLPPHSCLRNIYKELMNDPLVKMEKMPNHGDLTSWAEQGVFLLNTALTVNEKQAGSHSNFGWHTFTDNAIKLLNRRESPIVFMMWGNHAQQKEDLIDTNRHLVLKTSHPSGFSCDRGFMGCGHFGKTNEFLIKHGCQPINWSTI